MRKTYSLFFLIWFFSIPTTGCHITFLLLVWSTSNVCVKVMIWISKYIRCFLNNLNITLIWGLLINVSFSNRRMRIIIHQMIFKLFRLELILPIEPISYSFLCNCIVKWLVMRNLLCISFILMYYIFTLRFLIHCLI